MYSAINEEQVAAFTDDELISLFSNITGEITKTADQQNSLAQSALNTPEIAEYAEATIDLDAFMKQNPFFEKVTNAEAISLSSDARASSAYAGSQLPDFPAVKHQASGANEINQNVLCRKSRNSMQINDDNFLTDASSPTGYCVPSCSDANLSLPSTYVINQTGFIVKGVSLNYQPSTSPVLNNAFPILKTVKVKQEPLSPPNSALSYIGDSRPESAPEFHFVPAAETFSPPNTPHSLDNFRSGRAHIRKRYAADKSSDDYHIKRLKNNIAVRKSREKAKLKQTEIENRIIELETLVARLQKENAELKALQQKMLN